MKKKFILSLVVFFIFSLSLSSKLFAQDFAWDELLKDVNDKESLLKLMPLDLNKTDKYGKTALNFGIIKGLELVQHMVELGADINLPCDEDMTPPVSRAGGFWNHEDIARYLVEKGANLNQVDKNGNTPLHIAAYNGRKDLCAFYLDHGAKLEAKNNNGFTPFLSACDGFGGHDEDKPGTRRLLMERGANVKAVDKEKRNAINLLFCKYDDFPLIYNAYPDYDFLKTLVEKGVKIDNAGKYSDTPLLTTVYASAKEAGLDKYVRDLVSLGANVNQKHKNGYTPLTMAISVENCAMVQTLLDLGANTSIKFPDGKNIIQILEEYEKNQYRGFVYSTIKKIILAHQQKNPSLLEIPEGSLIKRENGKAYYLINPNNVWQVVHNLNPDEENILKIPNLNFFEMDFVSNEIANLQTPVILDMTEINPEDFLKKKYLLNISNVRKIIFSPHKKNNNNQNSELSKLELSNYPDLVEVEIPEGIKKISRYSFSFMEKLEKVVIPESATFIDVEAFHFCPALKEVVIKSKSTKIKDGAFSNCPNANFIYK